MTFVVNSTCSDWKKLILKSIRKKISSEPVFFCAPKRLWILYQLWKRMSLLLRLFAAGYPVDKNKRIQLF